MSDDKQTPEEQIRMWAEAGAGALSGDDTRYLLEIIDRERYLRRQAELAHKEHVRGLKAKLSDYERGR